MPVKQRFYSCATGTQLGKNQIDINDFTNILEAALDGIKMRGKSSIGEKTMIDAIEPALLALRKSIEDGKSNVECLYEVQIAAFNGVVKTKEVIAKLNKLNVEIVGDFIDKVLIGHYDEETNSRDIKVIWNFQI